MARTTFTWPFSLANSRAVLQSSFGMKGLAAEDEFNKTTTIHERGMKHFIYIDHGIPPCVRSKWTVCSSPFLAAWCNGVPQNDPANGKWGGLET